MTDQPRKFANPTEWTVMRETHEKRVSMRYNPATAEVEIMEEWFEDVPLLEAKQQREIAEHVGKSEYKPLAVIPKSVMSQAIKEGWHDDDDRWKRWMNDSDNSYLRIKGGRV
jgi:hypothetical protein